jgi:hypothetical protein
MGIRTPDLLIANETLYQLSYTPKNSSTSDSKKPTRSKSGKLDCDVDESLLRSLRDYNDLEKRLAVHADEGLGDLVAALIVLY